MQNYGQSSARFGNINYGAATSLSEGASVTFYSGATRLEEIRKCRDTPSLAVQLSQSLIEEFAGIPC